MINKEEMTAIVCFHTPGKTVALLGSSGVGKNYMYWVRNHLKTKFHN